MRPTRGLVLASLPLLVAAVACAPENDSSGGSSSSSSASDSASSGSNSCAPGQLALRKPGSLTIGTDSPAYEPWFSNNDPTNGKGYESAVAYAVADKLGFSHAQV